MINYQSVLAKEMNDFLKYYSTMNHDVRGYITIFNRLDKLIVDLSITEKRISKEIAEQFAGCFLSVRPYCFYNYISHYNVFARYLNSLGYFAFELELPKLKSDYTPYIFTEDEWHRIVEAADNFVIERCPLYSLQMPLLVRILYGCGTRINETLCLKVQDVDLASGVLHLRKTKNKRHRIVPMDQTLTSICSQYIRMKKLNSDDFLFYLQRKHAHWDTYSADNCFEHILKTAGITFSKEKANDRGPCLHCLRHTFVLNSLKKSEKNGRSFDDTVPFLSTYLGHASIRETDKYLRFSYELYDEAIDLIENYTADLFPEVK